MEARTDIEQPTDDISRDPNGLESVRNVSDGNRPSKRKPRNIRQVLSSHSQNPPKYHQQQTPQQQPPSQQQQPPSQQQQQQRQQKQHYGNAKVTGNPSLLVRRGTLRNSKQKPKPKPKKVKTSKQKKQSLVHIKKRISKVQGKISDELRKSESDKTSLIGKYTCKSILYFVIVYSVLLCLRSAIETYTEGMAHQVEQKYYFSHSSLDVLRGVKLIGFLGSITYVIFFTRNSHKPLLICLGALLCGLGAIIWPVPYYIDGQSYSQSLTQCGDQPTVGFYYSEMCHYKNRSRLNDMTQPNADVCSVCVLKNKNPWWDAREARFSAMCVGGFLIGLGTGMFATLGIVYIEENGNQNTCPIYYGILMSMSGLGKFLGSCIVWWFLGYTEDLSVKSKLEAWEIRAWWLGMVVLSIILVCISWVFLIFPKWLNKPLWLNEKSQQKLKYLNLYVNYLNSKAQKLLSESKSISNRRSQRYSKNRPQSQNLVESQHKSFAVSNGLLDFTADPYSANARAKDNPVIGDFHQIVTSTVEIEDPKNVVAVKPRRIKASKKLGKHCSRLRDVFMVPGFTLALLGVCFASYFPAGYRAVMSKYVHHQYQLPPSHSWFYTMGLSYSLAWCIGPAIGSLIIHRLQLTLRKQLVLLMLLLTLHISIFFFMFPISCPPKMEMKFNASVQRCMDTCSCANVQRETICNSDGTMYNSPCHASCSISLTCNCTSTEISGDNCIGNCPIYGLYWVFIFFATVIFSTGSVSVILFFLRTVDEEYKSMSISVAFWVIVVAAFVPGSAVYNGIANSSCSEYRKNCLSEMICSSYVPDQLRYVMNGSNVAFQGGATVVFLIIFLLSTTMKINFGEDSTRPVRLSLPESVEEEPRFEKRVRAAKSDSSGARPKVREDEGQVEKLRRHLQLVHEVEMRVELEKSSSYADIPAGRTRNELTPTSSSNLQEGMTQSNDSSTQRLIEASQQQPKTRAQATTSSSAAELPKERPLSNKEFVESYLSSIPDDFVYSREVSIENDMVVPGIVVVDPMDVRLGVDNLAYDPRESFLSNAEVLRANQARKSRSSNPDEILFM